MIPGMNDQILHVRAGTRMRARKTPGNARSLPEITACPALRFPQTGGVFQIRAIFGGLRIS